MAVSSACLSLPLLPRASSSRLSISSSNSVFFSSDRSLFVKKSSCVSLSRSRAQEGFKCSCLFGLGVPELAVIAGVAALVFGPKQLPEIGRSIGKTVKSFQQAAKEFEVELKRSTENSTESLPVHPVAAGGGKKEEEKKNLVSGAKESS